MEIDSALKEALIWLGVLWWIKLNWYVIVVTQKRQIYINRLIAKAEYTNNLKEREQLISFLEQCFVGKETFWGLAKYIFSESFHPTKWIYDQYYPPSSHFVYKV